MRSLNISTALLFVANTANATPSVEDACNYFFNHERVELKQKAAIAFEEPEKLAFARVQASLDRYETYLSEETRIPHGIVDNDGRQVQTGVHAYVVLCKVDVVDRRVLTLVIVDGPSVDSDTTLKNNKIRKISGVVDKTIDAGSRSDQGKF